MPTNGVTVNDEWYDYIEAGAVDDIAARLRADHPAWSSGVVEVTALIIRARRLSEWRNGLDGWVAFHTAVRHECGNTVSSWWLARTLRAMGRPNLARAALGRAVIKRELDGDPYPLYIRVMHEVDDLWLDVVD